MLEKNVLVIVAKFIEWLVWSGSSQFDEMNKHLQVMKVSNN